MPNFFYDLTGQRFGQLVVIERTRATPSKDVLWRARCDCGREVVRRTQGLRRGTAISCGCKRAADALENTSERFWNNVSKSDGCWTWTGQIDRDGYGIFSILTKSIRAHRYSYEAEVAPIPPGLQIDHLCRNRACVRPNHLEPVTAAENMKRGAPANKTHCKRGHEFTPENTYRPPATGRRSCRTCHREDVRADRRNRKEDGAARKDRGRDRETAVQITHCKHGHAFDEANTYVTSTGARQCRACNRGRKASRRLAKATS